MRTARALHGHMHGALRASACALDPRWYATSPLGAARGGNPRVNACTACATSAPCVYTCVCTAGDARPRSLPRTVRQLRQLPLHFGEPCAPPAWSDVPSLSASWLRALRPHRPPSQRPDRLLRGPEKSRGPRCPCCPGPRRQPSGRGRRRVLYLETAAAFRPCPRSLNLRCLCLSRHPDHCAWFEECDASALWLGPIDGGDGFMYTTYEVWGRAETV